MDYYRSTEFINQRIRQKLRDDLYREIKKQEGIVECYVCLTAVPWVERSLEHKVPRYYGGTNVPENLAIAHKSCNLAKGRALLPRTIEEEPELVRSLFKRAPAKPKKLTVKGVHRKSKARPENNKGRYRMARRSKNKRTGRRW